MDESNELLKLMVDATNHGWCDTSGLLRKQTIEKRILPHSFGFGWDPITKKFTASEEVWEDYFKSHPTHKSYLTDTFANYEDLRIAIGNGAATGRHSIGLGEETNARIFDLEENKGGDLDNLTYDLTTETFRPSDIQETSLQSPTLGNFTSSLPFQNTSSEEASFTMSYSNIDKEEIEEEEMEEEEYEEELQEKVKKYLIAISSSPGTT
ncbi:uncharacterized protein At2g29880-like [Ziziphus jujuba]|uniref:Uncharacterized protein At2g29880-like n=1 Tax=Ziziphus jujuba TaxID=326968 RepID=A0ABM3IKY0_ZIZJJ|nr:uncharacterized protein At2g29880-like [Ziziphus jujuba]